MSPARKIVTLRLDSGSKKLLDRITLLGKKGVPTRVKKEATFRGGQPIQKLVSGFAPRGTRAMGSKNPGSLKKSIVIKKHLKYKPKRAGLGSGQSFVGINFGIGRHAYFTHSGTKDRMRGNEG